MLKFFLSFHKDPFFKLGLPQSLEEDEKKWVTARRTARASPTSVLPRPWSKLRPLKTLMLTAVLRPDKVTLYLIKLKILS